MQRRMARFALLAVILTLLVPLSSHPAAAAELSTPEQPVWLAKLTSTKGFTCSEWIGTDYFSDASHTTRVGVCTITCSQFDAELPTFTDGGTCTGVSSSFTLRRYYACPGMCR